MWARRPVAASPRIIESNMDLMLISIDNNQTKKLFPQNGFDPKGLAQTLRDRRLHLSYTEDSLAEALALEPVAAYDRCLRIAEFAVLAGREWFSVGASLKEIIDHELKFSDGHPGPKFPRNSAERQAHFFSGLLQSRESFEEWHRTELAKITQWSDAKGRLAKDQADSVRGLSWEEFIAKIPKILEPEDPADDREQHLARVKAGHAEMQKLLATPESTQDYLEEQISKIPQELSTNWVVEKMVQDVALRARVTPERCPTLVALAGGYSLIRCGATMGVEKDWSRLGWLAPARNDWTDARITAQAAYAHVLVSEDKGLCRRAKLLQDLKLFRPQVMRWDDLLQRQPS